MSEASYESHFRDLLAKGLSTEEEIREARRLLQEAAGDGNSLTVAEALLRAGAAAAKAQHDTAPRAPTSDTDTELIRGSDLEVIERLGRGSQSVVYKCHQITLDRLVAVKILPTSMARNPTTRERFFREARHAARLSHPNIVAIHQISPLRNTFYIVMEYVDGGSVAEMLARRKRFDPAEAVAIVRAAAEGLACAHRGGIIHQDVKPKNLLLTTTGVVKLADLGVATRADGNEPSTSAAEKAAGGIGSGDSTPAAPVTPFDHTPAVGSTGTFGTSGKLLGTPYYMSPEQVTGDPPVDFRTDIYSLGATFYEMLTGRPPYTAATPQEVMRKHVIEPLPDPRRLVADLPEAVCKVVARAMAKEPEDRYPTAEDMIWDLDRLELDAPVAEELAPPPTPGHDLLPPSLELRQAGLRSPQPGDPASDGIPVAEEATLNKAPPGRVAAAIQAAASRHGLQPPAAPAKTDPAQAAADAANVAAWSVAPGKTAAAGKPGAAVRSPGKPGATAAAAASAAAEESPRPTSSRHHLIIVGIFSVLIIGVGIVAAIVFSRGSPDAKPAKSDGSTTVAAVVPAGSAAVHDPKPTPPSPAKSKTDPASKSLLPVPGTSTAATTKPDASRPATGAPAAEAKTLLFRIACGLQNGDYTDEDGNKWLSDQPQGTPKNWVRENGTFAPNPPPRGTTFKALKVYQSQLYGQRMTFRFNSIKSDKCLVRLHFCESFQTAAGRRVFSVRIQGQPALTDFDIFREAGGAWKPIVKEYRDVAVRNGTITIEFTTRTDNAMINGIEIFAE